MDRTERIRKTLIAHLETGIIWSLRIIIPFMIFSPLIPMKRYGRHPFWSGDMSYLQAMLFYSLIAAVSIFIIILHTRFKARRKANNMTEFKEVSLEVKKIEKRKYFNSTLFLLKDLTGIKYLYLSSCKSEAELSKGSLKAIVNQDTKIIIEIVKSKPNNIWYNA